MLNISDLHAETAGKAILKGITLAINPGEIHAIMGPNGAGKSTLAYTLGGRPGYEVTEGSAMFRSIPVRPEPVEARDANAAFGAHPSTGSGRTEESARAEDGWIDLLALAPHERAAAGLFLGFQYPVEIPGVSNLQFLREALNAQRKGRGEAPLSGGEFIKLARAQADALGLDPEMLKRPVNVGFSGGEKKRNEMVQMGIIAPRLAILDETDSGLDIDALKAVGHGINTIMRKPDKAVLLITHYQRLLDYVKPDHVHVLANGRIVRSGGPELALELEREGYADTWGKRRERGLDIPSRNGEVRTCSPSPPPATRRGAGQTSPRCRRSPRDGLRAPHDRPTTCGSTCRARGCCSSTARMTPADRIPARCRSAPPTHAPRSTPLGRLAGTQGLVA